jgi:hypothetical protein
MMTFIYINACQHVRVCKLPRAPGWTTLSSSVLSGNNLMKLAGRLELDLDLWEGAYI